MRGRHTGLAVYLILHVWALCSPVAGQGADGGAAGGGDAVEILSESSAAGFVRATSDDDLADIYKENLDPDFLPYAGRSFHVSELYALLDTLSKARPQKYLFLVVTKGNAVATLPLAAKPMPLTYSRMRAMRSGLVNATKRGAVFPDSVLLMNVWDEGRCPPPATDPYARGAILAKMVKPVKVKPGAGSLSSPLHGSPQSPGCPVPVFSLIKLWNTTAHKPIHRDVLLPFFNHVYEKVMSYPWEKKTPKALMRAAMQKGMSRNCTRLWIINLQKSLPEASELIDAGITNILVPGFKADLADYVQIPDHARWKWLLSADGFTASCRFGKLLQTNSLVLKETTPWIEYYYRSAKPDRHYLAFTKDNVLDVLRSLPSRDEEAAAIARAAQRFAYRYLSQHAKALYVRKAIQMYNALFSDMADFMSTVKMRVPDADGSGPDPPPPRINFQEFMETMKKFVGG